MRAVSLRKAAGLMQKQLAAAVGMSDSMISYWMNGKLPTGTEGNVDAKIADYLASAAGAAPAAGAVTAAASAAQELKNLKRPAPALAAAPRFTQFFGGQDPFSVLFGQQANGGFAAGGPGAHVAFSTAGGPGMGGMGGAPRKKAKATPKPEDVVIDLDSD